MNDKVKIVLYIIFVIILVIFMINIFDKDEETENDINQKAEIQYNNETEEYYVTDETGRIIHTADTEEELYIYTIDPDYDPKSPVSDIVEDNVDNMLPLQ